MRLQSWDDYTAARTLGPWKLDGFPANVDAKDEYWPRTKALSVKAKLQADFPGSTVTMEQDPDLTSGDDNKAWIFTITFADGVSVTYTLSKILSEMADPQGWNDDDDPDHYQIGADSAGNPGAGHFIRLKTPNAVSQMILAYLPNEQPHETQVVPADLPPFPAPAGQMWMRGMMGWGLAPAPGKFTEQQINDVGAAMRSYR